MEKPETFSRKQIILHWAVALLVAGQFLFSGGIERAWRDFERGEADDLRVTAVAHIASGLIILTLVVWRLVLRYRYGAPAADPAEPYLLQLLAKLAHFALYALLLVLPLSGLVGWAFGLGGPIWVHLVAKSILLPLIGLHVAGALVHHFYWRTPVLKRMIGMA